MRLLARDLKKFLLFKPTERRDGGGDVYNDYDTPPAAEFFGNLQPVRENLNLTARGADPQYDYVLFAEYDCGFREFDRIGAYTPDYEIKSVQRWSGYLRLMVKEVRK